MNCGVELLRGLIVADFDYANDVALLGHETRVVQVDLNHLVTEFAFLVAGMSATLRICKARPALTHFTSTAAP